MVVAGSSLLPGRWGNECVLFSFVGGECVMGVKA